MRGTGNKLKYITFLLNIKKRFFYGKGGGTQEQDAQRSCGVSVLGNTQNLTGRDSVQAVTTNSSMGTGAGLDSLARSLQISAALTRETPSENVSRTKCWKTCHYRTAFLI